MGHVRTAFADGKPGYAMRLWRFLLQSIQCAHERRGAASDMSAWLLRNLLAVEVAQRACRELVRTPQALMCLGDLSIVV
jgi:hypothetical protein